MNTDKDQQDQVVDENATTADEKTPEQRAVEALSTHPAFAGASTEEKPEAPSEDAGGEPDGEGGEQPTPPAEDAPTLTPQQERAARSLKLSTEDVVALAQSHPELIDRAAKMQQTIDDFNGKIGQLTQQLKQAESGGDADSDEPPGDVADEGSGKDDDDLPEFDEESLFGDEAPKLFNKMRATIKALQAQVGALTNQHGADSAATSEQQIVETFMADDSVKALSEKYGSGPTVALPEGSPQREARERLVRLAKATQDAEGADLHTALTMALRVQNYDALVNQERDRLRESVTRRQRQITMPPSANTGGGANDSRTPEQIAADEIRKELGTR